MDEDLFFDKNSEINETRSDLPHWSQGVKLYFITFRLADSLPQSTLHELRQEKEKWLTAHPTPWSVETEREYHHRFTHFVDRWLDANYGSCALKDISVASIVENTLLYYNNVKYSLHAYVIIPNHVHILLALYDGFDLNKVTHSWKSYSANLINQHLNRSGNVWWRESFDRIIRDRTHYYNVINYILKNVKQGGVKWML